MTAQLKFKHLIIRNLTSEILRDFIWKVKIIFYSHKLRQNRDATNNKCRLHDCFHTWYIYTFFTYLYEDDRRLDWWPYEYIITFVCTRHRNYFLSFSFYFYGNGGNFMIGCVAIYIIPISLKLYSWTSRRSLPWQIRFFCCWIVRQKSVLIAYSCITFSFCAYFHHITKTKANKRCL